MEYPVKTCNFNNRDWFFQTDTGPVLFPNLDVSGGSLACSWAAPGPAALACLPSGTPALPAARRTRQSTCSWSLFPRSLSTSRWTWWTWWTTWSWPSLRGVLTRVAPSRSRDQTSQVSSACLLGIPTLRRGWGVSCALSVFIRVLAVCWLCVDCRRRCGHTGWAEFIVRQPSVVATDAAGNEVAVQHYSDAVHMHCHNTMFRV
jgi:hypothetical protein